MPYSKSTNDEARGKKGVFLATDAGSWPLSLFGLGGALCLCMSGRKAWSGQGTGADCVLLASGV